VASGYEWRQGDWRRDIFEAMVAADVRQVAYVPDAGHASLIEACHAAVEIETTVLTTEEEGIGVLAGAHLGGQNGVLLMQSSGVGNCVNTFSLIQSCGFPLVVIVTMRGEWGEFNPWQVQMGQGTEAALRDGGFVVQRIEAAEEVGPATRAALSMAFDGGTPMALLLSQKLIGAKTF
jgi:sulfopyruvate decarboxylase alpha subunit